MDPDLIRLILVVLGLLLIAGIYLWDRYKRAQPRGPMVRSAPAETSDPVTGATSAAAAYDKEPRIDTLPETVPSVTVDDAVDRPTAAPAAPPEAEQQAARSAVLDPEPAEIGSWSDAGAAGDPQFSMDLKFDAHDDGDYVHMDPALHDDVERKLVVLHVIGRDGDLGGLAIEKACVAAQLRLGEMEIYHSHDGANGKELYSVASMVEPGSFPIDDMRAFRTPGLTLFTQLPGVRDGVQIFEDMLKAGRQLASLLDAELQDERHNKLTGQMERHIVESIIEHRRRVKLARSRH